MKINTKLISYLAILNGIIMLINGFSLLYFTSLYFEERKELGVTNNSGNFFFYIIELGFIYLVGKIIYQHYLYLNNKAIDLKKILTSNLLFTFISILISLLVLYRINVQITAKDLELTDNVQLCILYSKIIIALHCVFIVFYLITMAILSKLKSN